MTEVCTIHGPLFDQLLQKWIDEWIIRGPRIDHVPKVVSESRQTRRMKSKYQQWIRTYPPVYKQQFEHSHHDLL